MGHQDLLETMETQERLDSLVTTVPMVKMETMEVQEVATTAHHPALLQDIKQIFKLGCYSTKLNFAVENTFRCLIKICMSRFMSNSRNLFLYFPSTFDYVTIIILLTSKTAGFLDQKKNEYRYLWPIYHCFNSPAIVEWSNTFQNTASKTLYNVSLSIFRN
ncbi:unnamed protein product [Strongylus vulgaris]|uniref:Uncharacterized protein n=1 Tax=Strongylus vulgaris TaxID=40348 RepID=A0A3P7LDQ7_STRVU|nr:unnamed protein product [Strongylus vulgaris]